jgi:hypothetical protein
MVYRKKIYYFLVLVCLTVFGFTYPGNAADSPKESTAKDPAKGSNDNRTYRNEKINLDQYQAVFIENASVDTTASRNEKVDDFLRQMQGIVNTSVQQALQASGRFKTITTVKDDAKSKGKYLLCRSDVLVHFGSTAARFLIGMGAGKSKLIMVNSLEDPETGEVILKYTGWGGAIGGFGFQILGKMQADAALISQYFGNLAKTFPK